MEVLTVVMEIGDIGLPEVEEEEEEEEMEEILVLSGDLALEMVVMVTGDLALPGPPGPALDLLFWAAVVWVGMMVILGFWWPVVGLRLRLELE